MLTDVGRAPGVFFRSRSGADDARAADYNSVLMPQGVGAFAQQYVPGAGAAMNTFGQAQHTFAQVQHSLNTATSGQWSRRDVGDGFQEPQPGYMPREPSR